jgi:Tol biopolymer transport system component
VDGTNTRVIVFSNETDGMYKWNGAGNIAAVAAGPAARIVTKHENYLVGIVKPNAVHFSEYQDPDAWPGATNLFYMSGEAGDIESVVSLPSKLVVICREGIFYILGTTVEEFSTTKIYPNIGTVYPRSAASFGQVAGFVSDLGPYLLSTGSSDVNYIGDQLREFFSSDAFGPFTTTEEEVVGFMNQYHFLFTMPLKDGSDTITFVYDMRHKAWWLLRPPAEIAPRCWAPSLSYAIRSPAYRCGMETGGVLDFTELAGDATFCNVSGDGEYVTFVMDDGGTETLYIRDMGTCTTTAIATGSGEFSTPKFSRDGRYLLYAYDSSGVGTSGLIYRYSIDANSITVVSTDENGVAANGNCNNGAISGDGRWVAFASLATNLVSGGGGATANVFIKDTLTGDIEVISNGGAAVDADDFTGISRDGRYIVFSTDDAIDGADSNGVSDVYRYDRVAGTFYLVSKNTAGVVGNSTSDKPSIDGDGDRVVFWSAATNLVAGDTNAVEDVFLRDITAGTTTRLSVDTGGTEQNGTWVAEHSPAISADGLWAAFSSAATNLVAGDTNAAEDVFLRDIATPVTSRVSVDSDGTEGNAASDSPRLSDDGRYIVFMSEATDLVSTATTGNHVFIHDRLQGQTAICSVA